MQALANGDWFVGWGQVPDFSEFSADRAAAVRRALPARTTQSYRTFRFAWTGTPGPPAGVRRPGRAQRRGDRLRELERRHARGRLEGARGRERRRRLQPVAQAARSGFETAIALPAGTAGPYVTVQALDAAGSVLGTSVASAQSGLG